MTNLIADVKLAMDLETDGYNLYTRAAKNTTNPLAVATLKSLADRESLHREKVKEVYQTLTTTKHLGNNWLKGWEVPITKKELLKPILEHLRSGLTATSNNLGDLTATYQIAEKLEKESFELYDRLAAATADQLTQKFFTSLAAEEREHFAILDETLQYLNAPGDWFRLQERWIVEG